MDEAGLRRCFDKWLRILRIENQFDVMLTLVDDEAFLKTGDLKIDCDDKKAEILLNKRNPKMENLEEVIVHELLHLKLYPLDQLTENLVDSHYEEGSSAYTFVYRQFMESLEITVAELAKCFLFEYGDEKQLSFGRVKGKKSFTDLYEGLSSLNMNQQE